MDLKMSRRQIAAMIEEDSVTITLHRKVKVDVPGGGWRWQNSAGTPLAPQVFRLIPFKRRFTQILVSTELGDVADVPYVLLGRHDADIKRDDIFETPEGRFVVKAFDLSEPEVKTLVEVDYEGGGDNG